MEETLREIQTLLFIYLFISSFEICTLQRNYAARSVNSLPASYRAR